MTLPPYTGDEAVCVKCLGTDIATHFMPAPPCLPNGSSAMLSRVPFDYKGPGHQHRRCTRCGYCWDEDVAEGTA